MGALTVREHWQKERNRFGGQDRNIDMRDGQEGKKH